MSFNRRMTRPDASQAEVVRTLRKAGITVWIIGEPCDLLTYNPSTKLWKPLEVKPLDLKNKNRKDQEDQREFIKTYAVPIVRTGLEAIAALTLRKELIL